MSVRLLARIPLCILYQEYSLQRIQTYSTVFSSPKRRKIDYKAFEEMKTTLLHVLRPAAGREYGFGNRDDGYVSVKRLLNHPEFQSLDIRQLQIIVSTDRKHRFDFQFDPTKGGDSYWIRAKKWDETHWVMKPFGPKDTPGTPVYSTTLVQWHGHIARNGIPRGGNDWIEISRAIPTEEYLLDLQDNEQVFIFVNLTKCMRAGLRFFNPTPSTQNFYNQTPLFTKGNDSGYIPPSMFSRVELVTAKKNLLWGDPKPLSHKGWVGYDEWDLTPDGERKTYLQTVKGITGFVLRDVSQDACGLRVADDPAVKEEAMAILRS